MAWAGAGTLVLVVFSVLPSPISSFALLPALRTTRHHVDPTSRTTLRSSRSRSDAGEGRSVWIMFGAALCVRGRGKGGLVAVNACL